ncbi:SLC13 family permease [Veillonella caviae]|uniref:SLC13 family permease n=1 Tax=Veillonella caviae TaxID=248316 RepID=UPI0023A8256E|nr:SLC13 family permease [Veillonella caviae]MCI5708643.1 SLC13 family permease [Veillonella caviae]MDY5715339.1 SLC13 family permease [Veillonella caviae]
MINGIIILAIVLAIALGYKTKINTGLFGMVFAYIIGTFMMGLKPSEIIKMWPISIFFVIFSISLFYNFAIGNGTLEKLAQHLLYRIRKYPKLLPFAIFGAATIMSALGAGFFAVLAFFAPIAILLCKKTNTNLLTGALAANYGALCGHNFMISPGGIVFVGLMQQAGFQTEAYSYEFEIFLASFIIPIIVLAVLGLFDRKQGSSDSLLDMEIPTPFDGVQKKTLGLIFSMIFIVLIFPLLDGVFPGVAFIKAMDKSIDVGLISIIFAVIGLLMKLGNEKEIVKNVPWGTLIMICGIGMLISVAIKAGTVSMIASVVSSALPSAIVPAVMAVIGGFMSFFSSTTGVVTPALFPIVSDLAKAANIAPFVLFSSIVIGAQATAISPFSTGGSLLLSAVSDAGRESMFTDLMFKGAPICLLAAIVYSFVISILV